MLTAKTLQFFDFYFDTNIGSKLEALSYSRIAAELNVDPENVLFLSDNIGGKFNTPQEKGAFRVLFRNQGSQSSRSECSALCQAFERANIRRGHFKLPQHYEL
jgi:methionine salvage enolase-phosphatase E1